METSLDGTLERASLVIEPPSTSRQDLTCVAIEYKASSDKVLLGLSTDRSGAESLPTSCGEDGWNWKGFEVDASIRTITLEARLEEFTGGAEWVRILKIEATTSENCTEICNKIGMYHSAR